VAIPGPKPAAPDLSGEGTFQPVVVAPNYREQYAGIEESFVVKARILVSRPDGYVEVPLWLNTGIEDMPDLPVVESINIEWGPSVMGRIQLSMKMDYQTGRWFLDSELSRFRNALVVQAGYPRSNIWTPVFYGYTDPPQPSHDPLGYQITLSANIIGNRIRRLKYAMGNFIKGKATRRDVVREFLKSQKYDVYFYLNPATGRDEDNEWMDTPVESGSSGSGRFWPESLSIEGFIHWVCLEAGMRCVMWPHPETGEIYAFSFVNRATVMTQECNRELVLFSGIDTTRGIYPLTNFQSESPQVFMDNWVLGATASDVDPLTKEVKNYLTKEWAIVSPALEAENESIRFDKDTSDPLTYYGLYTKEELEQQSALAEQAVSEGASPELLALAQESFSPPSQQSGLATDTGHELPWDAGLQDAPAGAIVASPVGRDKDEEGRLQSLYEESLMVNGGLQAQLQTIGMPDAHPEMKVRVRRVGNRFDGVYNVRKVTHEISTIWNTTFEAVKHEFGEGSGLLKTNRPVLPQEDFEGLFPATSGMIEAEEADA